jgi:malonyl-CoA O-methyltransferase
MSLIQKISKAFSRKAKIYDENTDIQKICAEELLELINFYVKPEENLKILDIGCGTGFLSKCLKQKFEVINCDISFEMCKIANFSNLAINANMHLLPIKENSLDAVISSFSLHWSDDLEKVFDEIYKILKPEGVFIISLPLSGSLKEVSEAFLNSNQSDIINKFPEEIEILEAVSKFRIIKKYQKSETLKYEDLWGFLTSIKAIGASVKAKDTSKITKKTMVDASKFYTEKYSDNLGRVKIFWNNFYLVARK